MNATPAWDPWNYPASSGYNAQGGQDLTGLSVEATDGSIGHIDEATNSVGSSYLVVDTGKWIFGKKVMLPAGVIHQVDTVEGKVYVGCSKDEIKDSPEFDADRAEDNIYRNKLGGYYGDFHGRGNVL
ncbi:MAG: PRC-barrel domain containing protein [Longispora sp.]|nr:PRC-barrel domain containing protein [Longispora sp. (in: high G+C Gram-positive bacteria)]